MVAVYITVVDDDIEHTSRPSRLREINGGVLSVTNHVAHELLSGRRGHPRCVISAR